MAFSPQFLDELRARAGLAAVIGRRVRLTRKGNEHLGLCPFHKEKTPSFTVNEDKGFYHCFGCGAHGSVIDFVMQTEGVGFPEAVERLAAEAGLQVPADTPEERERARQRQSLYDVMEAAVAHFERALHMPAGKAALDYLHGRGLDDATIAKFRLGYAPDSRGALKGALARAGIAEPLLVAAGLLIRPDDAGQPTYDRFRRRVMFPISDRRGRVIAFGGRILGDGEPKYLNSPETPLFHKGRVLYGLAHAKAGDDGRLVVTEGYMDVIALAAAGFANTVAPLGTALTEEQIALLWRLAREPVLCFDGDAAGRRAAARAAERVLPMLRPGYSLRFALLPEGEDPDTLIRRQGAAAMARILEGAVPLSEVLWRMEARHGVPGNPDERAALQKRLEGHATRISDPTVRAHYLHAFKDRLWRAVRGPERGRAIAPAGLALDARVGSTGRIDPRREAEQTLITIVINHPQMFHQVEEQFGSLEFHTPALDALRQALVSILTGDGDLDADALREDLLGRGLGDALAALDRETLLRVHRLISPGAATDDVMATWRQSVERLRRAEVASEVKERMRMTDYSDEAMQRALALKRAELEGMEE